MKLIKDHPLSRVWLEDGYIYKWQPKFLTENEIWCLQKVSPSGLAPYAERFELEIIRMEFIKDEAPTDSKTLLANTELALVTLDACGIRHGDLTRPNVMINGNSPVLLDFAESRLATDPRPDKRPEGDRYWLARTVQEVIDGGA